MILKYKVDDERWILTDESDSIWYEHINIPMLIEKHDLKATGDDVARFACLAGIISRECAIETYFPVGKKPWEDCTNITIVRTDNTNYIFSEDVNQKYIVSSKTGKTIERL